MLKRKRDAGQQTSCGREGQKNPSFGVESLEPRVLLSATRAGEDPDVEGDPHRVDQEVELGAVNADGGELFGSIDSANGLSSRSNDVGSGRGWVQEIQAWFGFENEPDFARDAAANGLGADGNDTQFGELDFIRGEFGTKVTGNVLVNEGDPDGDNVVPSVSITIGPANGTLDFNDDGTFEYEPDAGFFGLDSFWYKLDDGDGHTEEVEVCIFIDAAPNLLDVPVSGSCEQIGGCVGAG